MNTASLGRREFLRLSAAAGLLGAAGVRHAWAAGAPGPAALRVGLLLPRADPAVAGADLGSREAAHAAALFRSAFETRAAPADNGRAAAAAAEQLIADRVHAIIGGGTPAAADAIISAAEAAGVLFLNVGCAAESLQAPCSALTFHIMPSDAMRRDALAAVPEAHARARVLAWHHRLARFGAAQINDRFTEAYARPMTERAWTGWIAVKILFDAAQRAGSSDAGRLAAHLTSGRAVFDGHKGLQLSFRPVTHQLRQPLYIVADDEVIAEVPGARVTGDMTHAQFLDTIGMSGGDRCSA